MVHFISSAGTASKAVLLAGVGLLIVGLGFKAALVPFHSWAPDVYEGAPTSITAYMSVGAKAAAFAALLRVFLVAFPTISPDWSVVLAIVATLTMVTGNAVALLQKNIKRMLGYSSIAHAGYILVAIVSASHLGATSLLVYAVAYAVMNMGAFAVVMALGQAGNERTLITDYAGLSRRQPLLAALMAAFMLSLAGIPPTFGFVGKFYVFSAAVEAGFAWLALIGLLSSVASVYYYLRVVHQMYMVAPVGEAAEHVPGRWLSLVAVVAATACVSAGSWDVPLIGDLPATLGRPSVGFLRELSLHELIAPAVSVALLAILESLLSATVADRMRGSGPAHRPNRELVGQGLGNLASTLFGGAPADRGHEVGLRGRHVAQCLHLHQRTRNDEIGRDHPGGLVVADRFAVLVERGAEGRQARQVGVGVGGSLDRVLAV